MIRESMMTKNVDMETVGSYILTHLVFQGCFRCEFLVKFESWMSSDMGE